jgi:hypothetical protein
MASICGGWTESFGYAAIERLRITYGSRPVDLYSWRTHSGGKTLGKASLQNECAANLQSRRQETSR